MSETHRGTLSAVMFEDGKRIFDCGLEDCECPEHENPPLPPGVYVTVRLPEDARVPLSRDVSVTWHTKEGACQ